MVPKKTMDLAKQSSNFMGLANSFVARYVPLVFSFFFPRSCLEAPNFLKDEEMCNACFFCFK